MVIQANEYTKGNIDIAVIEGELLGETRLTPFEARALARALLDMAEKLEAPKAEPVIEAPIVRYDMPVSDEHEVVGYSSLTTKNLHERIVAIHDAGGGVAKKLQMTGGLLVLVTQEVWEKESHLQSEFENDHNSLLNIKKDKEANWWLVDTLPF
jgi:SNF2 family DNA or RNA helicase